MKMVNFALIFKEEKEGGYTVIVPSLPGCVTYGKNIDEAKEMARDAIKTYLASLEKHHEEIPSQESILLSNINIQTKAAIYA